MHYPKNVKKLWRWTKINLKKLLLVSLNLNKFSFISVSFLLTFFPYPLSFSLYKPKNQPAKPSNRYDDINWYATKDELGCPSTKARKKKKMKNKAIERAPLQDKEEKRWKTFFKQKSSRHSFQHVNQVSVYG